ncbi:MAG: hypothetical protein A2Z99_04660 [Treponema sp. GWB1_62_6]|nr:MAG: hypothetical protein A2Y36_06410 [Treponema sp. GWA1_62_8]OHE63318.1 MAG: hypothetical protein A2001_11390 [Treponema sp. GWC1_61_84]OHE69187.1 MAG: hypothetical protein A2413_09150 [Treponema sp. RIFOXYC1_FULL_61_9]OHE72345.1 MAG: hypothetical protein A2Z99_04660 [Treponema sp. GWB1_62_6]HCM26305.1 hypothetical protein [Treponema sp.]
MDERIAIFERLKPRLARYSPPLTARTDTGGRYELWSEKELVIEGRKRKDVFFASLIIQSDYVGFYFMPVYANTELASVFSPRLLALLKGKSCFHIKRLDDELFGAIDEALGLGWDLYRERGWV